MAQPDSKVKELYRQANKAKVDVEKELEAFTALKNNGGGSEIAAQQRISCMSSQFNRLVVDVRSAVQDLPERQQTIWNQRAANLEDDVSSLQGSIDKQLGQFFKVRSEQENRKALGLDGPKKAGAGGPDDETKALCNEQRALKESSDMLDDLLGQGSRVVDQLVGQNKTLKGARKKVLDVAHSLGVSKSLVDVINRRTSGDKFLVYGGMMLTLFVLLSLWYLLKR